MPRFLLRYNLEIRVWLEIAHKENSAKFILSLIDKNIHLIDVKSGFKSISLIYHITQWNYKQIYKQI